MKDAANRGRILEGAPAWIISDGKAGHEGQSLGVAEALGLDVQMRKVSPSGLFKFMAPWGPPPPSDLPHRLNSPLAPPWPQIAIAAGRTTIPYIKALKRQAGLAVYTVILMDPRTSANAADLIWVPEHDGRHGPNVIRTFAAPHRFSAARLLRLRSAPPPAIQALPSPRIACLVGGPNGDYTYTDADIARLVAWIDVLAAQAAGLMVTTSRRTPVALVEALRQKLAERNVILWNGHGENPYPDFLANADAFIVTADSVSMLCEAAATGRPIHVFEPSGGGAKFRRFHAGLATLGATRTLPETIRLPLDSWSYEPVQSADVIASEIRRRWNARADMLPGLVKPDRA